MDESFHSSKPVGRRQASSQPCFRRHQALWALQAAASVCHFNSSSLGFRMDSINLAVTTFPLEAEGGRAAEYAWIVAVVSMGVVLAMGRPPSAPCAARLGAGLTS